MSDRRALLNAILAAPADDAPRLVYADWLDENGEPERAELIRTQCKLAKLIPPPRNQDGRRLTTRDVMRLSHLDLGERQELADRIREYENNEILADVILKSDASRPWFREFLPGLDSNTDAGFWKHSMGPKWFRRGFIEFVEITAADWLVHADAILAEHPVREVRLTTRPEMESRGDEAIRLRGRSWRSVNETADLLERLDREGAAGTLEEQQSRSQDDYLLLCLEWPGITFKLPPEPQGGVMGYPASMLEAAYVESPPR